MPKGYRRRAVVADGVIGDTEQMGDDGLAKRGQREVLYEAEAVTVARRAERCRTLDGGGSDEGGQATPVMSSQDQGAQLHGSDARGGTCSLHGRTNERPGWR